MKEVSDIVLFFGRFHPLVVHLPIGFLFFAFILEIFARYKKDKAFTVAVPLALLLGAISALFACILGYMLSLSGDYEKEALDTHFWFGIATTIIAFIAWLLSAKKIKIPALQKEKPYMAIIAFIVIILSITGHYGGNLTHGSDYLTAYLPIGKEKKKDIIAVTSIEEAQIFNHLVAPILDDKCMSCHNASKKKGQLSFVNEEAIQKGGKSGPVFIARNPEQSEMIRRVVLPPHDDKFMPPKGKTPLTDDEIAILNYWIAQGNGSFETTVGAVDTPENISILASDMLGLEAGGGQKEVLGTGPVVAPEIITELSASGFRIRELIAGSNLLDIALTSGQKGVTADKLTRMMTQLTKIEKNIIWLSLPANGITDEHLKTIAKFQNLKKLKLEKNPITDIGIEYLSVLENLESLNVYQTNITQSSIPVFLKMKRLKKVYIWGTAIDKEKLPEVSEGKMLDFIL
ncbi:DUF2231 domain-containing protein [Aquimarina sp. RZ0]|uniref:DUF2231 domain-containing protein n=1 Tax=Aquimarina sp. RZ0 TaxID=2607730 RepID=UPI0021045F39|nr:DUF2231 domain-containing protein [Aquimarina sp. RZ0]